jgi:hypothetical protein
VVSVSVILVPRAYAARRGALAKSISELASDWLVLTQDIVFLPCFHGIRLWIWPEPRAARKKGSGYENAYLFISVVSNPHALAQSFMGFW